MEDNVNESFKTEKKKMLLYLTIIASDQLREKLIFTINLKMHHKFEKYTTGFNFKY